jgi:membrane-bound serine protease (ClpP class)
MNGGLDGFGPAPVRSGREFVWTLSAAGRLGIVCGLLVLGLLVPALPASAAPQPVAIIEIEGVISPVTLRLVSLAIDRAQAERAQALIIQLDTPGGLERSMRAIVQRMMNAEVPVVVYVAPTGARAASAGVFITMAAHVAAMAPATNIGAASPVMVGGTADKTLMKKIENDAAAFIRTVAIERGRNADWAEKAVRDAVAITERDALKLKVIDLIADSVPDLLDKIDGRVIKLPKGPVTLATKGAPVRPIEIGFRDRFLNVITDPNVAYVLMMLGMIGLFFELSNPGVILPGVIGGISLILAFFAFQSLPINYAGLLLILFGIVLLIAEIKIVSHGVLAIGGMVSMALGSLMLFDAPEVGFRVSWWVIGPTVGATAGLFLFVVAAGVRALGRPPTTGAEGLVGKTGTVRERLGPEGQVMVSGELWRAVAEGEPLEPGAQVRIVAVDGLTLKVAKAEVKGGVVA